MHNIAVDNVRISILKIVLENENVWVGFMLYYSLRTSSKDSGVCLWVLEKKGTSGRWILKRDATLAIKNS